MIKKITLVAFLGLFTGLSTNAQSLANTYWTGVFGGTVPVYIHYTAAGVDIAGPDITFGAVATFTETSTTWSITDVDPASCGTDVGVYNKVFSNNGNTVDFTISNEPCTVRSDFFVPSGPWTKTTISVFEAAKFENTKVFPNPTSNLLNLELSADFDGKDYLLVNTLGQIVSEGTLVSGKNSIAVSELNSGLYMIKLKDNMRASIKFVKQ
jgi:hypothetical protein